MPEVRFSVKSKSSSSKRRSKRLILGLLSIALIGAVGWRLLMSDTSQQPSETTIPENLSQTTDGTSSDQTIIARKLKNFSGAEFVSLYNNYAYPNVREFEVSPEITGNSVADERIRNIAIERGYIARSVAVPPLVSAGEFQLQERAKTAWDELVAAAKAAGHKLYMTAGFRNIEDQRELFLDGLAATGATASSVAAGKSDAAVNTVLQRISIPGYTRHHSGYTVDIGCSSDAGVVFGASSCFDWLRGNNYDNAKKYGWIPSYPDGANNQGPNPEEWEYSWVGYEAVSEPVN